MAKHRQGSGISETHDEWGGLLAKQSKLNTEAGALVIPKEKTLAYARPLSNTVLARARPIEVVAQW